MFKKIIMKIVNNVQEKSQTKVGPVSKSAVTTKSVRATTKKVSNQLIIAVGNFRFWVHQGPVLAHLKDLEHSLLTISDSQYVYHVNKAKNDFAKWTKDVLKDPKTAELLKKAKSRLEASKIVTKALGKYK